MIALPTARNKSCEGSCWYCSKKIQAQKSSIICSCCDKIQHAKCANLTPNDLKLLNNCNQLKNWSCFSCNKTLIPFFDTHVGRPAPPLKSHAQHSKIITCIVCSKIGNSNTMTPCWICDSKVHQKCSLNDLGCKGCFNDTFPGTITMCDSLRLNDRFNPYCKKSTTTYVAEYGLHEPSESNSWDTQAQILNKCNYTSSSRFSRNESQTHIFSTNIRSLIKSIDRFRENIDFYSKFDILCFNETNCNVANLPFQGNELALDGFHAPFLQAPTRDSNKGGGLAIYVNQRLANNDEIIVKSVANSCPSGGEFQALEIKQNQAKNIIICNYYRSPNSDYNKFLEKIESVLANLSRDKNKHILLMGDSNIDLLKYGQEDHATKFVDKLTAAGLSPIISRPTRITDHSATLIDHIFSNNCALITRSGIFSDLDLSDHLATFTRILNDRRHVKNDIDQFETRLITNESMDSFNNDICNTDWNFVYENSDANTMFDAIINKYTELYNKNFPLKRTRRQKRQGSSPWLLDWLKCACARKNSLYRNFVKDPTSENKSKYFKMRKFVMKHVKLAKKKFYDSYFEKHLSDSKKQWSMINSLLNRTPKSKISINKLEYKNKSLTRKQDIAEAFNEYFSNIASNLKLDIQPRNALPKNETLSSNTRCPLDMPITEVTSDEVKLLIKSLSNKATSDTSVKPLKAVSPILSELLAAAITKSIAQGVVPSKLKIAKVIPLHKGGSKTEVKNYRPISLLSVFSKIYEKAMQSRLVGHLKLNNILFAGQYGFRAGHSCEHALLDAQQNLINALERKQVAALLLLDFSKAFDMVDHSILLQKLEHYGVRGMNLRWFNSYLTHRKQFVHLDNYSSETSEMKYGVPQGSILGPILFTIYINDLPMATKLAKFFIFADDSNVMVEASSPSDLEQKCNLVLNTVHQWVSNNGLKLNIEKTNMLFFTNNNKLKNHSLKVVLNGSEIKQKTEAKFLGVIMDSNLNWKKHIEALRNKISRNAGVIWKLSSILPKRALKHIYYSFIESHLSYCSAVWGATTSMARLSALFSAQKKAVRAMSPGISNFFYDPTTGRPPAHTKPLFNDLSLLALPNLIAKNILCTLQKARLKVAPQNIMNIFQYDSGSTRVHNTRQEQTKIFAEIRVRLTRAEHQIAYIGPRLYNSIVHITTKDSGPEKVPLQNKFFTPFKKSIANILLSKQSLPNEDTELDSWGETNFILYQLK